MRSWLGAGCAVALVCACASPRAALAQAADSAGAATSKASGDAAKPETKSNAAAATHKSSTKRSSSHKRGKKKTTARGQQKIDPERAQAIQEALIREHYLSGEAAGTWNQASEDAMRKYQADHGWQSKTVPDSRALISLGLGPRQNRLSDPESAMTTGAGGVAYGICELGVIESRIAQRGAGHAREYYPDLPADPTPATAPSHDGPSPQ